MPVTRRVFLQGLAAIAASAHLPALASNALTISIGSQPLPQHVSRVLSAGAPADMLLLAAAPEKLVGLSSFDFSATDCDWLAESFCHFPRLGRLSGHASTLSLEKLLALKPDLIIDCGSADQSWISQAERITRQTGIPWLLIQGGLNTTPQQLNAIGKILGTSSRTALQARLAGRFLAEAAAFSRSPAASLRFYATRGPRGLETGLRGSLHTEAAELLGLENVAVAAGRHGLAQVSMENLLLWQPDILLIQDAATLKALLADPIWQGVRAVANRRFCLFSQLPFGWLDAPPGLNRLLGMRKLHAQLDARVAATLRDDIAQFFSLFWQKTLSRQQLNVLESRK